MLSVPLRYLDIRSMNKIIDYFTFKLTFSVYTPLAEENYNKLNDKSIKLSVPTFTGSQLQKCLSDDTHFSTH